MKAKHLTAIFHSDVVIPIPHSPFPILMQVHVTNNPDMSILSDSSHKISLFLNLYE